MTAEQPKTMRKEIAMKIEPLHAGYRRQWVQCKQCRRVAYYDYMPYSLANPIMVLPCGHGESIRFNDAMTVITADDALVALHEEQ